MIIKDRQLRELYLDYDKDLKRFCNSRSLFSFEFSIREFEYCHDVFSDNKELQDLNKLDKNEFNYHFFTFAKLTNRLNLKNNIEVVGNLLKFYKKVLIIISGFQERLIICKWDRYPVKIDDEEKDQIKKEGKYRIQQMQEVVKNKGKWRHYFYEWFPAFTAPKTNILKYIDTVRKNLIENGDTIEMINNRDIVTSLLKHYEYLNKEVFYDHKREIPNNKNR